VIYHENAVLIINFDNKVVARGIFIVDKAKSLHTQLFDISIIFCSIFAPRVSLFLFCHSTAFRKMRSSMHFENGRLSSVGT